MGKYEARSKFWLVIMVLAAGFNEVIPDPEQAGSFALIFFVSLAFSAVNAGLSMYHDEP